MNPKKDCSCPDVEDYEEFAELIAYLAPKSFAWFGTEPDKSGSDDARVAKIQYYHIREKIGTKLQEYGDSREEIITTLGSHVRTCIKCFKWYVNTLSEDVRLNLEESPIEDFAKRFRERDSELLGILSD